jgi:uncharacterized protein (TIGR00255 family)
VSARGLPIYSMTGYATAQGATDDGTAFTLTMKSVNHRFLDLNTRLPNDCDALEVALRRMIKEHVKRGHIDVTLHLDRRSREGAQTVQLNRELLVAHARIFQEAAAQLGVDADPELHELLRMPGVVGMEAAPVLAEKPAIEAAVLALAPPLLEQLNAVRAVEGAALAAELGASMVRLRALAEESATLRAGAREAHFERLRARLAELLRVDSSAAGAGGDGGQPSDSRLLAEAAILVERSDIEEELVRLRTHIESFIGMLAAGGELGKRLDFLLQEFNREANTMLSKTSGADAAAGLRLTSIGLEMKAEIERVREQVQNLE